MLFNYVALLAKAFPILYNVFSNALQRACSFLSLICQRCCTRPSVPFVFSVRLFRSSVPFVVPFLFSGRLSVRLFRLHFPLIFRVCMFHSSFMFHFSSRFFRSSFPFVFASHKLRQTNWLTFCGHGFCETCANSTCRCTVLLDDIAKSVLNTVQAFL